MNLGEYLEIKSAVIGAIIASVVIGVIIATITYGWTAMGAIGAMLGGVGTWLAAIAAIVAAVMINKQTTQIAKRQEQISIHGIKNDLFDKRYKIYKCFIKYRNVFKVYRDEYGTFSGETRKRVYVCDLLFYEFKNDKKQREMADRLDSLEKNNINGQQQTKIEQLRHDIIVYYITFANTNAETIEMAEFCFNNDIYLMTNKLVNALNDFALALNHKKDALEPEEVLNTIIITELEKVEQQMKDNLTITEDNLKISFDEVVGATK